MVKYCIKRILLAILILFGVSVLLYILVRCMPVNAILDKYYGAASQNPDSLLKMEEAAKLFGLDDNSFGGILKGYFIWLGNVFQGNLGSSWKFDIPVGELIFRDMGISFGISFFALILELLIAIPLGIKCATKQYGKLDYTVTVLTMIGIAFPTFFLGNLMIKWFSIDLGWFESGKLNSSWVNANTNWFLVLSDTLWHLILPMFVLVVLNIGSLVRYSRTNTLEVLNADYIRTARAKGLSERSVVYKHVFRNTMIPLVTMLAGSLPGLFGGAMITETVFDLPGIGNTAYQALSVGDIPFIMGYNMFIAILTVVGVLLADLAYAWVDPRVKLGK